MYTTAELFTMAIDPKVSCETFLNSVTLSVPDDAAGCVDLDAEKARLSRIWTWRIFPCVSWWTAPACLRLHLQSRQASHCAPCRTGVQPAAAVPAGSASFWRSTTGSCELTPQ